MEQEFKVEAYGVKCLCDECKNGEMLPTEKKNFYRCTGCSIEKEYEQKYPLIRYRSV